MTHQKHQIVIIGAGTAGITVAAQLLRANHKLDIALIDPADKHYYQAAWTLVGAGTYRYENTARPMRSVIPSGTTWIKEAVATIDTNTNRVTTSNGTTIEYEYLVAAPGIQINIDALPGLREALDRRDGVCSVYVDPEYTWEVIRNFKRGTAVFTQPATAIKCGGAPQKVMYLADDHFRKAGVRDQITITYPTPGSVIFGTEPFKTSLMEVVDRKDLDLRFFHTPVRIDPDKKIIYYQMTNDPEKQPLQFYNKKDLKEIWEAGNVVGIPYDMMHIAPPQSAPDFIQASPLAYREGPMKGWMNINKETMQHQEFPNVFGLGDAAGLPTAKTGAAIRKQAPVLVANLLQLMKQETKEMATYDGYSSCPIVTGYGKMLLCEFDYSNQRASTPMITAFVDTSKPRYSMWLLKKYGLPFMYWNLMLKGRA